MANLNDLKKAVIEDRKIDASEVAQIRQTIFEDGQIDKSEAEFLFDLNDKCSGADNHSSWATLFAEAICSFLLDDEKTPGEVDKKEAEWLLKKLQSDGKIDPAEKKLLLKLKKDAKKMPENLKDFISKNA